MTTEGSDDLSIDAANPPPTLEQAYKLMAPEQFQSDAMGGAFELAPTFSMATGFSNNN